MNNLMNNKVNDTFTAAETERVAPTSTSSNDIQANGQITLLYHRATLLPIFVIRIFASFIITMNDVKLMAKLK